MTAKLLFLCTGNYFRSRFAEAVFNALASRAGLDWRADSRGIATDLGSRNVGPISVHTMEGLRARGIDVGPETRFPLQLEAQDLATADLIIALKEAEHRPHLGRRFPHWMDRVEYWHIDDLDRTSADVALLKIEEEVRALIERLSTGGDDRA